MGWWVVSGHLNGHRPFEQHALLLAKRYLVRVHPLRPASKVAILEDWPNLATTDEATIVEWAQRYPTSNVAIAPSPRGVVVDVDPRKGGWEGLQMLEDAALSDLPRETLSTLTGGSDEGLHLYFRLPEGATLPSSRVVAAGVEVKSFGAYLVAPGSIHPESGNEYRWVDPDAPILQAPEWLVDLVCGADEPNADVAVGEERLAEETTAWGRAALEAECRRVAEMPLGGDGRVEGRNKQVRNSSYAVGTLVAGGEIRYDDAFNGLVDAIGLWDPADGDLKKTRDTLMRGLADGMNQPRNAPGTFDDLFIPEAVGLPSALTEVSEPETSGALLNEEGQVVDVDQCPDPIPFTTVLPPFPTDAFPPWLREFVEAEAVATQTPADLAAFFALAAISTATANRVDVEAREGWREPVHLWLLVALLPGEKKSPVYRDVMEPLYRYQREERDRQAPELRVLEQKHRVASARLAKAEKAAVNADDPMQRSRADAEIEAAQEELDKLDVPAPFQLLADDVTAEAFAIAMHAHGRITIASAEGGIFENFSGRYSKGIPNLDALLKSHGAEHITITRVSREQLLIDRACATLALAVQPIVLSGLNSQPIMRGRGLLARFLLCLPQSAVGRRMKNPPPVALHVKQTYQRRIVELLEGIQPRVDPIEDRHVPHVLSLTPTASTRLTDWAGDWLESQLGERGRLSGITDWGNKLAGAAVRIAGLLHFAEHGSTDGLRETINLDTINAALRIAEYLIPHAQAALDLFDEDEATSNARTILAWIINKRPDEVSASIVQRTLNRIKRTTDAEPALEILAHRNFILPVPKPPPSPKGGHPWRPRWTPNPKLWLAESTYTTYTTSADQGCVGSVGGFVENEDANRGES
jgi:replicative DNA helicase